MTTKTCTLCLEPKPLDQFHRHGPSKDGRKPECKACRNTAERARRLDPHHRAVQTWHDINKRVRNQTEYAGVEVRMTRSEFVAWAAEKFRDWISTNPEETPSVDRENPRGHYQLSNLRVISLSDNCRFRSNTHNPGAPEGQAWCSGCQIYKPTADFEKNRARPNGHQHHCRQCRATSRRRQGTSDTRGAGHS